MAELSPHPFAVLTGKMRKDPRHRWPTLWDKQLPDSHTSPDWLAMGWFPQAVNFRAPHSQEQNSPESQFVDTRLASLRSAELPVRNNRSVLPESKPKRGPASKYSAVARSGSAALDGRRPWWWRIGGPEDCRATNWAASGRWDGMAKTVCSY